MVHVINHNEIDPWMSLPLWVLYGIQNQIFLQGHPCRIFFKMSQGEVSISVCKFAFFACIKESWSTLGSIHPFSTASMIKPLGESNPIAYTLDHTQSLRVSNPTRACMHTLMALSCKCVQIKFLASSQNFIPRRTLPGVQVLPWEDQAIKNEALHFKFEFPCIVKGPLLEPFSIAHDLGAL